ncbi:MAG: hypothetical protein HQL27_04345 [Candidatus Omnitrophica bacterium]|nr:hypothetical protein [Candidatus Omnitrophota bacterium]
MALKKTISSEEKGLIRRYLTWCYKTTKESLDRIDRYFTQHTVDNFMLSELNKGSDYKSRDRNAKYYDLVQSFIFYMDKKYNNALAEKFEDVQHTIETPNYKYLKNRLKAIEKAICHFLGKPELGRINNLYESEMTKRIFESRDHK